MLPGLFDFLSRTKAPPFSTAICGHRGASAPAPENTLSAFRGALEAGCDAVELDVFLTRDGHLAVIHDEKLGRTTDRGGRIQELSLDELRAFDAGTWFTESFAGEKVPVLREALVLLQGRASVLIEVKQSVTKHPGLVEALAEDLDLTRAGGQTIAIVWDIDTADAVRERIPDALVSLVCFTRRGVRRAGAHGLDGVVSYFRSSTRRLIDEAHDLGLFVAPWTVNLPKEMDFFCRQGADMIITDLPHVLLDTLERLELERTRELIDPDE